MADLRPRGFQSIPPVIKNLIIVNVLFWIAELTFGDRFIDLLALHHYENPKFGIWQVVTYMFLHSKEFFHILINMFVLWMFGSTLEDIWGSKRFLIFYLICGVGAALVQLGVLGFSMEMLTNKLNSGAISLDEFKMRGGAVYWTSVVGASGAINGVMAAFAYTFPNAPLYIYGLFPVKAKYLVIAYFLLDLFGGINPSGGDNVAHFAHVGGAIVGLILVMTMNRSNRRTFY
ncbi:MULTISPECIES: rhomboid family intramembrane serine protease [Niastella]|uniref:Rhomboid family intramembrane serine protease n=1 Tax=Niastella soli TaxID=2821487 RepID=A0ABS3YPF8_9BACT|nr:rhomboid family intramembrane serine protease [Niastella soli]MBO9199482.1 rhomboid family intramembrane serine protease [Niastella soli]